MRIHSNYINICLIAAGISFISMTDISHAQDGMVRTYHDNGKIETAVFYIKDVIDGAARVYYSNQQLKEEKVYVLGVLNGWTKEFYVNGAPKLELYLKFGKRDGMMREYYENGGLKKVATYEEGRLKDTKEYAYDSTLAVPAARPAPERASLSNNTVKSDDKSNEKDLNTNDKSTLGSDQKR